VTVATLRSLEAQFLNDQKITASEAQQLVNSTSDWGAFSAEERAELKAILVRDARKLEPAARQTIERFLGIQDSTAPVIVSRTGANPSTFADDSVFLGRDGTQHGESGITAYTRGYDSTQAGPLRFAHGSAAPASRVLSAAENQRIREMPPGAALDAAAKAYGVRVGGFQQMAHSKDFFDPKAEFWWGKCHAWAWAALDQKINNLVDVEGPEGKKGVWIGGQWMSRADLGNWMMATADEISLADPQTMFKGELTASELVKGTTQFMMNGGGGVVADIHNDEKKGHKEVWNQPFVASDLTTRTLDGQGATAVLKQARKDGYPNGVSVKQLTIVGTYGAERGDDHEGAPGTASKKWNVYAVTDASGKMITAYMADDAKLKGVGGLPTKATDDLPEYFWKPKLQALDDVLAGKRNANVENDRHGAEFKFFVGTVLTKGVSGTVRSAFEAELQAAPMGPVDAAKVRELARKYPGVANAYSPDQWRGLFQSRGLDAKAFGASWPIR
jgi:hypothetical protein